MNWKFWQRKRATLKRFRYKADGVTKYEVKD